jgi:UDP-glucose 4-epimerase
MTADATVLVTGGAGYIGSHTVLALIEAGMQVVVLDDLSTGSRAAIPAGVPFIRGDAGDADCVGAALERYGAAYVLHFAGSIQVAESVARPIAYYQNNTAASLRLIETCIAHGVAGFIFSSTAAAYGEPATTPIAEDAPTRPINPYGWSKLMTERILLDSCAASAMRCTILRYFNVAGADPAGRVGQGGANPTHLIKLAAQVAVGLRPHLEIFGTDYPTRDGTCIRDYIHVADLAAAHVAVGRRLIDGGASAILNCGYGSGYSVRDVVAAFTALLGRELPTMGAPRRAGDAPELVADAALIRRLTGWEPAHDDLAAIVASAVAWERRGAQSLSRRAVG